MIYGYCRVSTKGQLEGHSIEEQSNCIKQNYPNAKLIIESNSAAKERPIFNKMIGQLQEGDLLVVTKLDRFCRTTKEGLQHIDELMSKGVKIHILNMGRIDTTPLGRMILTNLLAFAEFERAMIIERTQSGKTIAKQNPNYREGRPKKYSKIQMDHAMKLLETHSYTQVAQMTGISKATLCRENSRRK